MTWINANPAGAPTIVPNPLGVGLVMIETDRDLAAVKQILHRESDRLQYLAVGTRDTAPIERKLSFLYPRAPCRLHCIGQPQDRSGDQDRQLFPLGPPEDDL